MVNNRIEKRSALNLISGLGYQILSMSLGLLLPYLFIMNLGSESNGLLSSVGQIYVCLGLLEAGVGTATVQALYKPLSQNNRNDISGILAATNRFYRKTGTWYAISVVVLTIAYPLFVDSNIPDLTIRCVIATQGISAVFSFFVQAKYNLLLKAEGKHYVLKGILFVTLIVRNAGKIVAIYAGYGLVAIQLVHLITVLLEGVYIIYYVKKHYPWLRLDGEPDFEAISQKNAVFLQSIAWMVFNHTDILVLTVISRDLALVSVYSVYSLLYEAGQNIVSEIRESFQYKIGNLAQGETKAFSDYFTTYSVVILAFTLAVFSAIYLITQSFIGLYTAGTTDINYLVPYVPELFFLYRILYGIRALNKQIIEANGHFRQTGWIPITEAGLNVSISILLVWKYGIVGVLIGTCIALTIGDFLYMNYLRHIVNDVIRSELVYLFLCIPFAIFFIYLSQKMSLFIHSWLQLIIFGAVAGVLSLLAFSLNVLIIKHFK